jgi:uncharacterized UPF0160 family protein
MNRSDIKMVAVHNGVFHADEIAALALLQIAEVHCAVDRLAHQTDRVILDHYDLVIDLGKKHDNVKYFDHHQDADLESSNMLVYKHLVDNKLLVSSKELDVIMKEISDHDRGLKISPISQELAYLNSLDIYSEEQEDRFAIAIGAMVNYILYGCFTDVALEIIAEEKRAEERSIAEAAAIIRNSLPFEGMDQVLFMPMFNRHWKEHLNGTKDLDGLEAVVWYDESQNNIKAQVIPDEAQGFGRVGKSFDVQDETMDFVHVGQFFCVAKDMVTMKEYLQKCNFK